MPITINGSGSITGLSVGGLPDGSITNDDLAGSITDAKLSGTTCKAWVNFNGTGTVAIRASYNVSSITDNGTGDYTVNFTTALADADYSVIATTNRTSAVNGTILNLDSGTAPTTTAVKLIVFRVSVNLVDTEYNYVAIFR